MAETLFEHSVGEKLKSMENRLSELEAKMTSIDTKLTQVVDAILGNPLTKNGGFIDDIDALKEKIDKLEKDNARHEEFKKKIIWTVGIIAALGAIAQFFVNLYSNVTK